MRIIIGFSRAKSKKLIMSTIIQKVLNRPFSHVYVRFSDAITNRPLIFEASHGMVHFGTYERLKLFNVVVEEYFIDIDNEQYMKLWNFMLDRLEVKYSLLGFLWAGLKELLGIKVVTGDGEQSEICSELAARVCESLGLDVPGELDYVTPKDLQKFVSGTMKKVEL
jgi:hypothetical protein